MLYFSPQERQVILFLAVVVLIGTGINFAVKRFPAAEAVSCSARNLGKIELNEADKDALMSIPGIGEKLAFRILSYRAQEGKFMEVEDLKKVKGIGAGKFARIRDMVYVK
ncbi:MAG: helix-hairpin-helix domain-containing protein [Candidatus Omnitrophica bacterium]|nr:helix-hairpin-helix domain-containing protein [Candidatus Omnitrophota bacterium]